MKSYIFVENDITETIGVIFLGIVMAIAGLLGCCCGENGVLSEGLYYESPTEKVNLSAIYESKKEVKDGPEEKRVNGA